MYYLSPAKKAGVLGAGVALNLANQAGLLAMRTIEHRDKGINITDSIALSDEQGITSDLQECRPVNQG
jgi:hypothetical protein